MFFWTNEEQRTLVLSWSLNYVDSRIDESHVNWDKDNAIGMKGCIGYIVKFCFEGESPKKSSTD